MKEEICLLRRHNVNFKRGLYIVNSEMLRVVLSIILKIIPPHFTEKFQCYSQLVLTALKTILEVSEQISLSLVLTKTKRLKYYTLDKSSPRKPVNLKFQFKQYPGNSFISNRDTLY